MYTKNYWEIIIHWLRLFLTIAPVESHLRIIKNRKSKYKSKNLFQNKHLNVRLFNFSKLAKIKKNGKLLKKIKGLDTRSSKKDWNQTNNSEIILI